MDEQFIKDVRELSVITNEKCRGCSNSYGCCEDGYGKLVFDEYQAKHGFKITSNLKAQCRYLLTTEHDGVENSGCSVPPEFRPLCVMYVCEHHLYEDNEPQDWDEGEFPSEQVLITREAKKSSFCELYLKLRDRVRKEIDRLKIKP